MNWKARCQNQLQLREWKRPDQVESETQALARLRGHFWPGVRTNA